jgi:hypothetical protein
MHPSAAPAIPPEWRSSMRLPTLAAAFFALALPISAFADPAGTYDLTGLNPDNGETYKGTVTVTRTGDTYSVVWKIGNDTISGIGTGIRLTDGRAVLGPANADDVGLSVSYESGGQHGTATYFEQPDSSWHGIWAFIDWKRISTEDWRPRDRKPVTKVENKTQITVKSIDRQKSAPEPQQVGPKN